MRVLRIIQIFYLIVLLFTLDMLCTFTIGFGFAPWYLGDGILKTFWPFLLTATYPLFWGSTFRSIWGKRWVVLRATQLALSVSLTVLIILFFIGMSHW